MKRILVTGSNGFVGTAIVNRMKELDYEIAGLGRGDNRNDGIDYYMVDLASDYSDFIPGVYFDVLIHTAARNPYQGGNFDDYFRDNIKGTDNVIRFAHDHGVKKIIYLQGVSSYGAVKEVLNEDSQHNYGSDYGISKYVAEKLIRQCGIDNDVLILPGIVGKGCNSTFLTEVVNRIRNNEDVYCYNCEGLFNNALYVKDLVDFIVYRLEHVFGGSNSFLLGCSEKVILRDLMEMISKRLKSHSRFIFDIEPHGGFFLDIARAEMNGFKSVSMERIIDIVCDLVCNSI